MGKVSINESTLTAIGNAIRKQTGKTDLIAPGDMPAEIRAIESGGSGGGGIEVPASALQIKGNLGIYYDDNGRMDWFINAYGDQITTNNLESIAHMFFQCTLAEIPFELNLACGLLGGVDVGNAFAYSRKLTKMPTIAWSKEPAYALVNLNTMVQNANGLKTVDLSWVPFELQQQSSDGLNGMFSGMNQLRTIPEEYLSKLYNTPSSRYSYSSGIGNQGFFSCYTLDEIKNLYPPTTGTYTFSSNMFTQTVDNCFRLKDFTFAVQDDGTPHVRNGWTNQVIDMVGGSYSSTVGWCASYNLTQYGIPAGKEVTDDASYQALKNDPDWWTKNREYSRYNHDSAVNTINSLPDVSGSGGTNTIKFDSVMGRATDGGAIGTLTDAEIAVAAAKGWTVTLR